MRHPATGGVILCLPLLLASYASADEAADRAAIDRTIAALNQQPRRTAVFTADVYSELDRLPDVTPREVRITALSDGPTVTISHEPWGEAALNFPGSPPLLAFETLNPRITSSATRFITTDVTLTDGAWTYTDGSGVTQNIPLLFVMRKEADNWKIASVRVLPPH